MDVKQDVLVDLGLNVNEAKAYLALLEAGSATAHQIADISRMHRTNVYDTMKRLAEKSLASYVLRDNTKYFLASSPACLVNLVKDKELRLQQVMPELELSKKLSRQESPVSVYNGVKALMDSLYELLEYQEEILAYGIPKQLTKPAQVHLTKAHEILKMGLNHFNSARTSRGINIRIILGHDAKISGLDKCKTRILPTLSSCASTVLCSDEIVIAAWTEPVRIIRIKNLQIAESYKQHFELLWNIS